MSYYTFYYMVKNGNTTVTAIDSDTTVKAITSAQTSLIKRLNVKKENVSKSLLGIMSEDERHDTVSELNSYAYKPANISYGWRKNNGTWTRFYTVFKDKAQVEVRTAALVTDATVLSHTESTRSSYSTYGDFNGCRFLPSSSSRIALWIQCYVKTRGSYGSKSGRNKEMEFRIRSVGCIYRGITTLCVSGTDSTYFDVHEYNTALKPVMTQNNPASWFLLEPNSYTTSAYDLQKAVINKNSSLEGYTDSMSCISAGCTGVYRDDSANGYISANLSATESSYIAFYVDIYEVLDATTREFKKTFSFQTPYRLTYLDYYSVFSACCNSNDYIYNTPSKAVFKYSSLEVKSNKTYI